MSMTCQPLVVLVLGLYSMNNTHTSLDRPLNMCFGLLDELDTGSFTGQNIYNIGIQRWMTQDQTSCMVPSPRRFGLVSERKGVPSA